MPGITLDPVDAAELAETLASLADWLSGSQNKPTPTASPPSSATPAYNTGTLRADLHRFVFLLGVSDGEELFGEPTP